MVFDRIKMATEQAKQDLDEEKKRKVKVKSKAPKRERKKEIVQAPKTSPNLKMLQKSTEEVAKNLPKEQGKELRKAKTKATKEVKKQIKKEKDLGIRKPEVASKFTSALEFFAPQVIGGLIGAAFEGTEGAVAGVETSGQLRDSFREAQQSEEVIDMKRQQIVAKAKNDDIARRRVELAESNLQLRERDIELKEVGEERRKASFELTRDKAGQLSDKQAEQFSDLNTVLAATNRIEELRQEVDTGPLAGRVQSIAQLADLAPERYTQVASETANTLADYVKSISGAQVSEQEAQRLAVVIPSVNDAPEVFERKLKQFQKIVGSRRQEIAEAIRLGQPLKAETVRQMMDEVVVAQSENGNAAPQDFGIKVDMSAIEAEIKRRGLR